MQGFEQSKEGESGVPIHTHQLAHIMSEIKAPKQFFLQFLKEREGGVEILGARHT
jgi:hypothetical protein